MPEVKDMVSRARAEHQRQLPVHALLHVPAVDVPELVRHDGRELILVGASGLDLRRKAIDEGMITLRESGLRKVREGVTTLEEVVRETVK